MGEVMAHDSDTIRYQDADTRHHLHPFTDYRQLGQKGSRVITRADGVYLWDSEGHRLLDATAGLWSVYRDYVRKEPARAAPHQSASMPLGRISTGAAPRSGRSERATTPRTALWRTGQRPQPSIRPTAAATGTRTWPIMEGRVVSTGSPSRTASRVAA